MSLIIIFEVDLAIGHGLKWHEVINFSLVYASQLFHVLLDVLAVAEL